MMPEKDVCRIVPASGNIRYFTSEADAAATWVFVLSFKALPGVSAKLQVMDDDGCWKTVDGFGWFTELGG